MLIRPDNRAGPLGANPIQSRPIAGRTGAGAGARQDPLAGLLAAYPHPETDAQLQSRAQGMIDPLVQALTDGINRRATAGAGAIRGYTQQEMADLGKYADSAKNIYGGAQQSQAASDSALADRLQGNGAGLAAGLAGRLKGIGNGSDPAVAAAAADQTTTGQGSGNALYGKGSASLADLIARGAGAQDYASKLPGIASLGGAQSLRDLEMSAQNDIATGADQIQSKIPDLIASLRSGNDQKQANLAAARAGLYQWQTGRQDTKAQNAANQRERAVLAKMSGETSAAKAAQDWQKFQISENDRNARATNADANRNARTQAQIDAANTRASTAAAARVKAANAKAAAAQAKAAAKPNADYPNLTKTQVVHLRSGIAAAFNGIPEQKVNGKVTQNALPPVNYQQAIDHAVSAGYSRAAATRMANHFYMPGQRGRPGGSKDPAVNPNAQGPPAPGTGP